MDALVIAAIDSYVRPPVYGQNDGRLTVDYEVLSEQYNLRGS
jgi:hypothetical protein